MPYNMNEHQFKNVMALSSYDSYIHFITKVADWQLLWSIELNGDQVLPQTPDELKYLPVWPHPEYAKRVSTTRYPDSNLREISSEAFLGHWLPVFEENNVKIAVFPNEVGCFGS